MKIFVINLGGTSTKVGLYEDETPVVKESLRHAPETIKQFPGMLAQYDFRKQAILDFCAEHGIDLTKVDAFISRGASVKPLLSGVYSIDDALVRDMESCEYGNHVCGLGCAIVREFAGNRAPALTADPPCVDEMLPVAKYTGLPQIRRRSFFQALSHKAVGRRLGKMLGRDYDELALVISHLGSGISVASHLDGRVIDVTNGLDGDAPFGMDRPGTLPAGDWMRLILSGEYSHDQVYAMLNGKGGVMAHLGTNNALEVQKRIDDGDAKAREVFEAMAFQVAKALGAAAAALGRRPDAIALAGGLAFSEMFVGWIRERVEWIAKVYTFPDEDELDALVSAVFPALRGEREILTY